MSFTEAVAAARRYRARRVTAVGWSGDTLAWRAAAAAAGLAWVDSPAEADLVVAAGMAFDARNLPDLALACGTTDDAAIPADVFLEETLPGGLLLRHGPPPLYRLAPGLQVDASSSLLTSDRPAFAARISAPAARILVAVTAPRSARDVAGATGQRVGRVTNFLRTAEEAGFVVRLAAPDARRLPPVSIVVPAHGRPAATRATVQSLLRLDYPAGRLEIIVVDDASDPPLAPALGDLPVRLLWQAENGGPSSARNRGARAASAELVGFVDNDCVVEPGWLRRLVAELDRPEVDIVGGRAVAAPARGAVAAYEAVRSPLDLGAAGGEVGPDRPVAYLPAHNLLVRREALVATGGFRDGMHLGEDVDFVWRAIAGGSRVRFVPEARVAHDHRTRLAEVLRRRAEYASSEAALQRLHEAGRRVMHLPRVTLICLLAVAAAGRAPVASVALAGIAVALLGHELAQKQRRLRDLGAPRPLAATVAGVLRAHGASLYHLSATVGRYHGIPLALLAGWSPLCACVAWATAPLVDHRRTRPALGVLPYLGMYLLETTAYQVGVLAGCLRHRTWRPLAPRLVWRR